MRRSIPGWTYMYDVRFEDLAVEIQDKVRSRGDTTTITTPTVLFRYENYGTTIEGEDVVSIYSRRRNRRIG